VTPITVGDSPIAVALADLSGEGHLDLIVARTTGFVSVLLGNGNGAFQPGTDYAAGGWPNALAVGDIDGDQDLDVAIPILSAANAAVFLNDGSGALAPKLDLPTSTNPSAVALGELNGDGRVDLMVGFRSSNVVSLFLGQGGGAFQPGGQQVTIGTTSAMATADLDEDGHLDLVVGNDGPDGVTILLGNGAGGFGRGADLDPAGRPTSIVAVDVNADGHVDVATSNSGQTVSLFLGVGDGAFGALAQFPTAWEPTSIAAGDLTADGRVDLLTASWFPGVVALLVGNGDGTFGNASKIGVGEAPRDVAAADLNGDGFEDLVTPNAEDNTVSVLLGQGGGAFGPRTDLPAGGAPGPCEIHDVNRDGRLDLVVTNPSAATVSILLGDGSGGFGAPVSFAAGGAVEVAAGDLSRDGNPDLVVVNGGASISVLLGDGSGSFGAPASHETNYDPNSLVLEDLNADGFLDVAVASSASPLLAPAPAGAAPDMGDFVSVFFGDGAGSLAPRVDYHVGSGTRSITSADMNGDGHRDLIVGGASTNCCDAAPSEISVVLNNGDGTFGPETKHWTGSGPHVVRVADLNGDGELDLVALRRGLNAVTVVLGSGGGGFGTPREYGTELEPVGLAMADLDGNGTVDLAVANARSSSVSILLNQSAPPALQVSMDVRPLACPNVIHPKSNGFLSVALMGTAGFRVADLDPASVLLEGLPPARVRNAPNDIGTPSTDPQTGCTCSADTEDGLLDQVFAFRIQDVLAALGPRSAEERVTLTLTGARVDGTPIEASDCAEIDLHPYRLVPSDGLEIDDPAEAPARLWAMRPNPMLPSRASTYAYRVPDPGAEVSIAVHSVSGRRVVELARGFRPAGIHSVTWNGQDAAGAKLAPGVYFVQARVGSVAYESSLVLVR
jgi:hypothetical protein